MKLLIVTQAVDTEDPVLGFFVRWIEELASRVEHVEVICLKLGRFNFPKNVHVPALGKEHGAASRAVYAWRFLSLAWKLRHEYDAVFVHMNQEYILIAGLFWKLFKKRTYLWRNHYAGSFLTDIAAAFCTKIFCTSKHSYTARYAKTALMPVGVDTDRFFSDEHISRTPHSILFLGRIAPSKRPEMLIDALALLAQDGGEFSASIVGSPLKKDEAYYESLKEKVRALGFAQLISFHQGVPNSQTPALYRAHEVFVNTSPSGMLDKTIFEAAASGCTVFAASKDFSDHAGSEFHFDSARELAQRLVSAPKRVPAALVREHSLSVLAEKLIRAILST